MALPSRTMTGYKRTGSIMQATFGRNFIFAAGAAAFVLATASMAARAECRAVTVSATGPNKLVIDDATSAASAALTVEITKIYGAGWSAGSHRNGEFTCKKVAPSPRSGWTCTATTTSICGPQ